MKCRHLIFQAVFQAVMVFCVHSTDVFHRFLGGRVVEQVCVKSHRDVTGEFSTSGDKSALSGDIVL
jgi:hypothetical protein